jgi:site-specific recombinase XerD
MEPRAAAADRSPLARPRHEGACRLLADGVDIRIIQLMLGHASIQQTQRYLNVTDEELRRGLEVSWNDKGRPLRLAAGA